MKATLFWCLVAGLLWAVFSVDAEALAAWVKAKPLAIMVPCLILFGGWALRSGRRQDG